MAEIKILGGDTAKVNYPELRRFIDTGSSVSILLNAMVQLEIIPEVDEIAQQLANKTKALYDKEFLLSNSDNKIDGEKLDQLLEATDPFSGAPIIDILGQLREQAREKGKPQHLVSRVVEASYLGRLMIRDEVDRHG